MKSILLAAFLSLGCVGWAGDSCSAKMEQAMRDMEPYVNGLASREGEYWVEHNYFTDAQYDKMIAALARWEDTKRDCWSKQP